MTNPDFVCICLRDEIENPGSMGFSITVREEEVEGFLVRYRNNVTAFVNQCPHTGATLNWMPDQFLNLEKDHIQCGLHGAMFRMNDGLCVWGPCRGQALQALQVDILNDEVWIGLP